MHMSTKGGLTVMEKTLSEAMAERMANLGISRRELSLRTGLSRQTINNIENGKMAIGRTLAALDQGLYWRAGTALALSQGNDAMLKEADLLIREDDGSVTRWTIVLRVSKMSIKELEQMTVYLDNLKQHGKTG